MPTKYNPPDALRNFVSGLKTDLRDPESRNKNIKSNLSPSEKAALSELQTLQKNRIITIKACDKGSGLMIMDTPAYVNACRDHLASSLKQADGSESPYYKKVDEETLEQAKIEITAVLDRAHKAGIISDHEMKHMSPSDKTSARFYALPKVHKNHVPGEVPPLRPIISGSGSITEGISHFVQDQIKDISKKHPSYLEDTPDLLRQLKDIGDIPDGAILATIDVSALYSNIQREDGLEAVGKALETRKDKSMPASFILELLDLVLK